MIRKFFAGLGAPLEDAREFVDRIYWDLSPAETRELAEWERQFGLVPNASESARRLQLAAAWRASGGQSAWYLEQVLQTAGFNVHVHEAWVGDEPRDPRLYTQQPLVGSYQCTGYESGEPLEEQPQCAGYGALVFPLDGQAQCENFLSNIPGYIVNKDLTAMAPPAIPSDPATWGFFIYVAGETVDEYGVVPPSRRDEFERLILKIRPTQNWIVLRVLYPSGVFDETFDLSFD